MITPTPDKEIIVPRIMLSKPIAFLLGSQVRGKISIIKNKIIQKISILSFNQLGYFYYK